MTGWKEWIHETKDFKGQTWFDRFIVQLARWLWSQFYIYLYAILGKDRATALIVKHEWCWLNFMLRPVTVQTPDGVRYYCRARKGDINVISDYYEGQQIKRYWKPKPGDVVIDCGSNVGKYALIAARRGARTFAVEPDRSCIPILRRNRKLNDVVDWLTIIHAAIGASVGERTFYLAKDGARSTTRWVYTYKPRTVTVSEITIDEIVSSYRLTRLDWLKLDVEASEYEAIEGAKKSLPLIRYVYLEVHYADLEKKINDVLLPAGFTVVEMARLDKNRAWLLYSRE